MLNSEREVTWSQSQRGITLIELIVTVAVIAIIATVAVPSFTDMMTRARLVGAAQTVHGELQRARSVAIKKDEIVYVYSGASGANWCVALSDVSAGCDCNSCTLNENGSAQSYVTRASDFANVNMIPPVVSGSFGFDPDLGMVTPSTNGVFHFSSGGMDLDVRFTRLGRFNLCYPAGSPSVLGYEECL